MQIERNKDRRACRYCRDPALDDEIAQIESRAQACLSMTEMQAMTQSAKSPKLRAALELAWLYDRIARVTRSLMFPRGNRLLSIKIELLEVPITYLYSMIQDEILMFKDFCYKNRHAICAAFICLVTFFLAHPYKGLDGDAVLYLLNVIQSWYPERFVGDLAFIGGSQDSFSLFSYLYKPAIRIFGVHDAALLISATSLLFWGIAVALLIKAINKKWTAAIFIFLASFELSYGPTNWLRFGEFLCTSRTLTEALAILGFLFLFKNQKKKSFALFFAGTLMHPLIAGWGLLIWSFVYYPKTVIPVGLFSLFFPLTVFIGKLPFAAFDPVWADAAKEFAWNPYKMGRAAAYFAIVFCASRIFFQAQRKMWNGILITALIAYYWTFAGVFLKHVFLTQVQPWRAEWILMLFSLIFTGHTFLTALQWKHFKKIFKLQPVLLSVIGLAAIYLVFFNLHGQQNLLKYNGGITSLFYTCPRLSLFLLSFAACLVLKRSKWKLIVYAYALGLAAFAVYLTSSADFESSEASRQLDIFLKEKEAPFAQSVRGDYAHLLYAMPQMTERVFWATGSYYGANSFYSMSEERFSTTRRRIAKILNEQDVLTKPFVYPYSWNHVSLLLDNPQKLKNMAKRLLETGEVRYIVSSDTAFFSHPKKDSLYLQAFGKNAYLYTK